MIKNKVDPSKGKDLLLKDLLLMFIDDGAKKLGIPVISNVNELRGNFILFVTTPDTIKTADDNIIEVEYLKNAILVALESNQKIVLAYEALSDPSVKEILNDPEMLRSIRNIDLFPESVKKELDVIIEIKEKYKDRFEIEPIGVYRNDAENLEDRVISKKDFEKYANGLIVEEALDLYERYKDTTTVLFYTDAIIASNILDKIENNIKDGRMKEKDTAEICVFVPPKDQVFLPREELKDMKRDKTLPGGVNEFLHIVSKNYDDASIFFEIPIYEVKDIKSAIEKVEYAGFDARVVNWNGYEYLQISKEGYSKKDDQEVVEKLKTVAIDVSKEDYSDHIRQLRFEVS